VLLLPRHRLADGSFLMSFESSSSWRGAGYACCVAAVGLLALCASPARAAAPGSAGTAYPQMPAIAAIGERIDKYMDVPAEARGLPIDAAKGYRLQDLGDGLYMVTDNVYQSMFMVYDGGVVVADAPPNYAAKIPQAIAEVTRQPITHVIYSHSHADHIGGMRALGGKPVIIAHRRTLELLARADDPQRPLPTVTFDDRYTLEIGGKILQLSYHGDAHQPGNIFIYAPKPRVLMVVDVVFPGWMPWRRFAVAHDVPGYFAQVELIRGLPWRTLVGGHVARTGSHRDVDLQWEFLRDLRQAATEALATTRPGVGLDARDAANPWAGYDNFIDRVAIDCVNRVSREWSQKLAAFDVYIWDQCYAMEQSLRID
jgi:glyoxylase-like metal-dependent hydrolase (beta-lactamase superfamily II)